MSVQLDVKSLCFYQDTEFWANTDFILKKGEIGYDYELDIFKIGNGVSSWPYLEQRKIRARDVPYDNTRLYNGIDATNVQDAIDEIAMLKSLQ